MSTRRFARSSVSGGFVSLAYARRFAATTTVVETVQVSSTGVRRLKRRRAARHLTEENRNRHSFKAGQIGRNMQLLTTVDAGDHSLVHAWLRSLSSCC
jgi:hypothetical protein